MIKIAFFFLGFIMLYFFYKVFTLLYYYFYLRIKLRNASLDTFIKVLGDSYQQRIIYEGVYRYKWYKGWIVVRATFDQKGNLVRTERHEYDISKPITEFTLSKY